MPYGALLEKAGCLLLSEGNEGGRRKGLATVAIDIQTAEEDLLKYPAFIRPPNSPS
jgi:hypothetical protein